VNHPLSDEAILKLISDKSFIGCCGARARCFHNNFINNQICTEEIGAIKAFRSCREETRMLTVLERNSFLLDNFKESMKSILLSDSNSLYFCRSMGETMRGWRGWRLYLSSASCHETMILPQCAWSSD